MRRFHLAALAAFLTCAGIGVGVSAQTLGCVCPATDAKLDAVSASYEPLARGLTLTRWVDCVSSGGGACCFCVRAYAYRANQIVPANPQWVKRAGTCSPTGGDTATIEIDMTGQASGTWGYQYDVKLLPASGKCADQSTRVGTSWTGSFVIP